MGSSSLVQKPTPNVAETYEAWESSTVPRYIREERLCYGCCAGSPYYELSRDLILLCRVCNPHWELVSHTFDAENNGRIAGFFLWCWKRRCTDLIDRL
jgi:hypothetical protein